MHNETFEVTDEYEEERLDKFLAAIYPEQSRSFFQKLIKDGLVLVNDVPQSKANYRMHIEDMVSVTIPDAVKTTICRYLISFLRISLWIFFMKTSGFLL